MLAYQRVVEQESVGETIWLQPVVSKPGLKVHMLETTSAHQTPHGVSPSACCPGVTSLMASGSKISQQNGCDYWDVQCAMW
jgi:hypothetical protein